VETKTIRARKTDDGGLLVDEDLLRDARLGPQVRIVVQEGEIRLLPDEEERDWAEALDELAGCLGQEPAEAYDFDLKRTYPYKA